MSSAKDTEKYSEAETKRRFEAALRGARVTGHKTMKDVPKKRAESQGKATKKPAK